MTMTILTPTRTASVLGVLVLSAGLLVTSAGAGISDGRSPDTKDAATASASVVRTDLRSPDTLDPAIAAALQAATPQVVVVSGGSVFDWTDAGIGAAGGFAIALLLGGIIVLSQRGRQGRLAL
jgi:hypothetical protein